MTADASKDRVAISTDSPRATTSAQIAVMRWVLPVPGAPDTTVTGA